jgi:hypothetical protein
MDDGRLRFIDRRAFLGAAATLAAGATLALSRQAAAADPPDPDKVAKRLDKVADDLEKAGNRLARIHDAFINPSDPDVDPTDPDLPAIRAALGRIMSECQEIDRLADDMLSRLPPPPPR